MEGPQDVQIVGGDFGRGRCPYQAGTFLMPDGSVVSAQQVAGIDVETSIAQWSAAKAIGNSLKAGAVVAPVAILAAPAAVAAIPFGLTIAAIGAGLALFTGNKRLALVQVRLRSGAHFVLMSPSELAETIRRELQLLHAAAQVAHAEPRLAGAGVLSWRRSSSIARTDARPALEPPPAELCRGSEITARDEATGKPIMGTLETRVTAISAAATGGVSSAIDTVSSAAGSALHSARERLRRARPKD